MTLDCSQLLDDYADQVYEAMDYPEPEWRGRLDRLANQLLDCWKREHTADLSFGLGFIYFHMPGRLESDYESAKTWLDTTLNLDANHHLARWHLGMIQFYFAKALEASRTLDHIPSTALFDSVNDWRGHKVKEILLCCELLEQPCRDYGPDIEDVLAIHRSQDEVWPLPSELVDTVMSLAAARDSSEFDEQVVRPLIESLTDVGLANEFQDEIREGWERLNKR